MHHVAIRGTVSFADLSIDLKTRQARERESYGVACTVLLPHGYRQLSLGFKHQAGRNTADAGSTSGAVWCGSGRVPGNAA